MGDVMENRLLNRREVEHRVGLSRSAIYRRMSEGTFPRPLDLGGIVRWQEQEIAAWIASLPRSTDAGR